MSGGVDSSVAAALLKVQNFEVVGVFIKVWQPSGEKFASACTWRDERRDAMRVAGQLEIPLVTLDLEKEYKKSVVDYLVSEYKLGRTPNPDVMCNREIKFGAFYKWAREHGADYIVTGHYAIRSDDDFSAHGRRGEFAIKSSPELLISRDRTKDQTYFLWTLTLEILAHTLFPIGGYKKSDVRKLAKKFKLPTAEKKDSQGLCFVGKIDFKDFLKEFIIEKSGDVLNEKGEKIGEHNGAMFYTLGERHGFTIIKKTPDDKAYYVIAKDIQKNTLTVSHKIKGHPMSSKIIRLKDINWINGKAPKPDKKLQAQIRYHGEFYSCKLTPRFDLKGQGDASTGRTSGAITFLKEVPLVAPGQSCVIYDGEICLGGGVVDEI
mgnify:FL=1